MEFCLQGSREFIYLVPAAEHFADYRPYELKIVPHTTVANLADYSTMSAAGVTHFFHGQVIIASSGCEGKNSNCSQS